MRLARNLSDRFAAVAPIIAQLAPGYAYGPTVDVPMLHLFGDKDDTVRLDSEPGGHGFIYTAAAQTAKVWANHLSCDVGPSDWENQFSNAAGLVCTAYSNCRASSQEVVSCMEPSGRHVWPRQRVQTIPATCVTEQQYDTMAGQEHCPESSGKLVSAGMDVVWDFFSCYPIQ
jgi:poly(3-hydroxybutyrate) depolymerase